MKSYTTIGIVGKIERGNAMKVKVNATIVMDIEALEADKNFEHFADYVISESYVVEAPTYDLANVEVSKQLEGWHWWCIWSVEPTGKKDNRVFVLYNDELYEKCH